MRTLSPKRALAISGGLMCTLGIITASLGPSLPDLTANTATTLATIGALFSALFLGGLLTQLLGGPINDRFGQRPLLLGGITLMAVGTCGIAISHTLLLTLACGVIAGMGRGAISISAHLLIAEVFAARSAMALNLLNVFYGVGAVAGPAIAGLSLRAWGTALLALWIGAAVLLIQAPIIMCMATSPRLPRRHEPGASEVTPLRIPLLWLFGALLLLYVGCETGIGGWLTTYVERTAAIDTTAATLIAGCFWLAITGGRVIGAFIGSRLPASTLLLWSLCGGLLGAALLVFSAGNATLTTVAVIMMGVCFGPIYPTSISIVAATFRRTPGTAVSVASAMGGLGGMVLPWLQGIVLDKSGPTASMLLIIVALVCMLVLAGSRSIIVQRSVRSMVSPSID